MDRMLHNGDPVEVAMSPERIERVRGLCAAWAEQGLTPSLQVLVARHGVIVLDEAWGRSGPEDDAPPLTTDALFGIASITKPITATAILCLVEDGLVGLNRPVQEYLPEFVGDGKEAVMVHHLLTHTSGLRTDAIDVHLLAKIESGELPEPPPLPHIGPREALHYRCGPADLAAPLSTAPGTEMSYCNTNYHVLAEIAARVSGQPVEQLVQERIAEPLGMTSTSYHGAPPERHARVPRRAADAPYPVMDYPDALASLRPGAGTTFSTAHDVATFVQMHLNGGVYSGRRVLRAASIREMTRDQIPGISSHWNGEYFPEASWGYGWGIQGNKKALRDASLLSARAFVHGGNSMSFAWADPAVDLVGVYLSILPAARWGQGTLGRRGDWCADLFSNAVTAAVVD